MRRKAPATCTFVDATGAKPCGEPAPRALDGRALCDTHLLEVLDERAAKARARAARRREQL